MPNIPKVVRERLEAATPAVNHPDADVLTAFAERSLPELERAIVMEHLARCGDCRDILALAVPAMEPTEAATSTARGRWLSWPTVRWAFVAAGIVAIASIGVVRYERRELATTAEKQAARLQSTDTEAKNVATSLPMAGAPVAKEKEEEGRNKVVPPAVALEDSLTRSATPTENRRSLGRAESPQSGTASGVGVGVGAGVGQLSTGPKMPEQWQQRQDANAFHGNAAAAPAPALVLAPPPPPSSPNAKQQAEADRSANLGVPPASRMVEVQGAAAAINTQQQALDARVQDKPTAPQDADDAVGKAKPALKVEAQAAAPMPMVGSTPAEMSATRNQGVNGRNTSQLAATQSSTTFRWTVNPEGGLERSVDRGNSWQGVDVNASGSADSTRYAVAAKTARAKDRSDDKKQPAASPIFRAVAAMGAEVWAGGSTGALYHSSDSGNHWTRVVPSVAGEVLTGDVIALEFSDPMHGKVTTSTPEVWTTADGGQTWQKQ